MNREEMDSAAPAGAIFAFDDFRFDVRRARLQRGDAEIALTPKAFAILECLVRNAGRLVEKSTLLDAAWPTVVVEESNLSQTIYLLRRALGEQPSEHRYIVTVPGRGYRFVAAVRVLAEPDPSPQAFAESAESPDSEALSPRANIESSVATSAAPPTPDATRVRSPKPWPWVRAAAVVGVVVVGVGAGAGPTSEWPRPAASAIDRTERSAVVADALARGRFLSARREPGDLERARAAYEEGLALAPGDAALWSGLASAVYLLTLGGSIDEAAGMERTRVAAERAIALDPSLGEPYVRLALYHCWYYDSPRAHEYLERARAADPGHPLLLAVLAGRAARDRHFDEAAALSRKSLLRDPLNLSLRGNLVLYLMAGGRAAEAESEARRLAEIHDDEVVASLLGQIHLARGEVREAERWFGKLRDEAQRAQARALLRVTHDSARADPELQAFAISVGASDPFAVAEIYAYRGEADRAFEWLQRAVDKGSPDELSLATRPRWSMPSSPLLASLRADARWASWERAAGAATD